MCANMMTTSTFTVQLPKPRHGAWPALIIATRLLVGAFREALTMRREAQRRYLLNDE